MNSFINTKLQLVPLGVGVRFGLIRNEPNLYFYSAFGFVGVNPKIQTDYIL